MVTEYNHCSAVVVGTAPLTVLTASHCLQDAKLHPVTGNPIVSLYLGVPLPAVKEVIYSQMHEVESNLARDIAVLIFDGDAPAGINAIPISNKLAQTVKICGYGRGYQDRYFDNPSCADKAVLSADDNFYRFVPQYYQQLDPQLHLQFRAQFTAKNAFVDAQSALLAVNRVTAHRYDLTLPMPTRGDSGGPWMVNDSQGGRGIIALTSFVETFYRKNKQWSFFKSTKAPLSDFSYAAYGVRLNTREARELLDQAREAGADIQTL
ncbi:Trypsin [Methylophaga frappieri]|uniref:Trypsin n=2 Tax=Methylophaga frappieri (strain ATCC BAA-2434 / DSM 25690 / JAM7) TaxID=754477 RepID=I1YHV7_METFJ|nr:Trypsin [Methylophaga frappieri]